MMNIETLKTRVENATKKIQKLEQKLERINVALNGGKNPYYYTESDQRSTMKDLDTAKENLKKYEEQLAIEINKENAPKIQVLVDFLESWKTSARNYYIEECKAYAEMRRRHSEEWENCDRSERRQMSYKHSQEIKDRFSSLVQSLVSWQGKDRGYCTHKNELEKMLNKEVKAKYEDLVYRISKVTGEIKDCSNLYIGSNGSINGFVTGEKAKAHVETILAGGYNIQCLHYRVLVNKIK